VTPVADRLWTREAAALLRTFLRLRTLRQARRFLRDLMTTDEIRMLVNRWWVARLLHAGHTYREIGERTGLSSRTIARISLWLQRGAGGYGEMLQHVGITDGHRHPHRT
jgi:TrpR-related protein YerC/YecD